MSISGTLSDFELQKFVESETRPGQAAVEIVGTINATSTNPANGDVDDTVPTVATLIGGSDGTDLRAIKVNASGELVLAPGASGLTDAELRASPVEVDGSGVTQPISAAALPLPSGASTSALQSTANASLASIDGKLDSPIAVDGPLTDTELRASAIPVSGTFFQATQPVSGPLTDTQLRATPVPVSGTVTANFGTIAGVATEVTLTSLNTKVTAVDTGAVVVASSALPTGAATAALQTQPGVDIGDVTINNASGASAVNIQDGGNSITVDGTFWQATQPVSAASLPLPTGAATSANQATEIASLANLDVALSTRLKPADTLAAVTTITNVVHVDDNAGSLTIDNANLDVALSTRLKPADTLAAVTTVGTITNVVHVDDNAGSLTIDNANLDVALSTRLKPADTLTAVTTVGTITNVVHVDDNAGSLTIDNANLDVALSTRLKPADTLTAVTTLGTITNVVHVDDNAGSLTIDNANLISIDAKMNSLGQKTMANSMPVTLASDQTNLPNHALTSATGSFASGGGAQTVVLGCAGLGTVKFLFGGTWTGQWLFESTYDGAVWVVATGCDSILLDGQLYTSVTNGVGNTKVFSIPAAGYHSVRARTTGISAGTSIVTLIGSAGSNVIEAILGTTFISDRKSVV